VTSKVYRSTLESEVAKKLIPGGFEYEPKKVLYTSFHEYTPDFVLGDVFVEVKGFFRQGDTKKYKDVSDSLVFEELVFVLQKPHAKVRKGAKLTMAGWCDKHNIRWYTLDTLEDLVEYAKEYVPDENA